MTKETAKTLIEDLGDLVTMRTGTLTKGTVITMTLVEDLGDRVTMIKILSVICAPDSNDQEMMIVMMMIEKGQGRRDQDCMTEGHPIEIGEMTMMLPDGGKVGSENQERMTIQRTGQALPHQHPIGILHPHRHQHHHLGDGGKQALRNQAMLEPIPL